MLDTKSLELSLGLMEETESEEGGTEFKTSYWVAPKLAMEEILANFHYLLYSFISIFNSIRSDLFVLKILSGSISILYF